MSSLPPDDNAATMPTATAEPSVPVTVGSAPDDEVNRVHTALHDIGARLLTVVRNDDDRGGHRHRGCR